MTACKPQLFSYYLATFTLISVAPGTDQPVSSVNLQPEDPSDIPEQFQGLKIAA